MEPPSGPVPASSDTIKGAVVASLTVSLAFQTSTSRRKALCCGHCLRFVGSLQCHLELASGSLKRSALVGALRGGGVLPTAVLPGADLFDHPTPVPCAAKGCSEVYCSESCRATAASPHAYVCAGGGDEVREFRRHALAERESLCFAAQVMLDDAATGQDELEANWDEVLSDSWLLLSAAHQLDGSRKAAFGRAAAHCARLVPLIRPSPLAAYSRWLLQQSESVRSTAAVALEPLTRRLMEKEEGCARRAGVCVPEVVVRERRLARLGQAADSSDFDPNPFVECALEVMVSMPAIPHSCCPSATFVARADVYTLQPALEALHDIKAGDPVTIARIETNCPRSERLRLLKQFGCRHRAIGGESESQDSQSLGDAGSQYASGLHAELDICKCDRCLIESGRGEDIISDAPRRLHVLACQAMQQARFDGALGLWTEALRRSSEACDVDQDPRSLRLYGEMLHGIGGAHLEAGRPREARLAFKEGAKLAPDCKLLVEQAAKDAAYFPACFATLKQEVLEPSAAAFGAAAAWDTHHLGGGTAAFLTKAPLVTEAECKVAVEAAEAYANHRGGWTTARHYAVPTTDVPVHEIPDLLLWFNGLLAGRLGQLLQAQWGRSLTFRCLDAFLVRYKAGGGQRHLPVHRDQSTHSVTLALNGSEDFDGGGTYFCSLGSSLHPPLGHVLSFEGGKVLHGGDPVTRGTRYIIAAFLLAEAAPLRSPSVLAATEVISSAAAQADAEVEPPAKKQRQGVLKKWW